ncbi:sugar-transfer associated ATP-grasp domain-containing protein [Streptomyces fuscichromogenes]|uniref:sugar-transfer associated ATP-grasp domain-containing protein n=1 Tax=Streptomyces fuscichromogenes TaxID=1324013 RepID=UPI0016706315|nr:sugar-transfer associated ATP-grasp domain-containing protein [Streptomyces fuscichromogenes]
MNAPRLAWGTALTATTGPTAAGRMLRALLYGIKGAVDVWRHRQAIVQEYPIGDAVFMALRTSCDSRDIAALRKCGRRELNALHGVVPRARRTEYRDWNNCAVAAALLDDKAECNRRLGDVGIDVPHQIPLGPASRVWRGTEEVVGGSPEFSHPTVPHGTRWMLKDRFGLQGESVWAARSRPEPDAARPVLMELVRSGRLVAEELLRPEGWFADCGDTALPTLRVVTSRLGGHTEAVGMVLFRGAPGTVAANRRQGGLAHLVHEDGSCGAGLDAQGVDRGPCGYVLPPAQAAAVRHMCTRAHDLFPCVGSVGWDVGLSDRGPVVLEGNPNWGMNVPQLMPGRPMLEEFRTTRFRAGW